MTIPTKPLTAAEQASLYGIDSVKDQALIAMATGKATHTIATPSVFCRMNALAFREAGVSRTTSERIEACLELARRGMDTLPRGDVIHAPHDTLTYVAAIARERREHMMVLLLNARNQVIETHITSVGHLSSCLVHPRETFQAAVKATAAAIILAHNHPSGDTSPSQDDVSLTRRMQQAGEILGIDLLDHVIVGVVNGEIEIESLKERGLI